MVGLKKRYSIFHKSTDFGYFWLPKSIFSTYRPISKKSLVKFLETIVRGIVLNFDLYISSSPRGRAVLQVDIFKIRYFSQMYFSGSAIYRLLRLFFCFLSFVLINPFWLLVIKSICFGYSWTTRWKTAIFDDFSLFWAFFFGISSLVLHNGKIYLIHLFRDKIPSKYRPFRPIQSLFCCVAYSDKFLNWTHFTNFCNFRLQ